MKEEITSLFSSSDDSGYCCHSGCYTLNAYGQRGVLRTEEQPIIKVNPELERRFNSKLYEEMASFSPLRKASR